MFVNKIPFFTTVSRDIKFTTVEGIEVWTIRKLVDSTHKVHALYSARGFKLTNANLDGEFIPMRRHLQEMGIIGNFDTRSEHVPDIERQIRVLKERACACRQTLPFQILTSPHCHCNDEQLCLMAERLSPQRGRFNHKPAYTYHWCQI